MLYALVLGTLIDEFALSKAMAGLLGPSRSSPPASAASSLASSRIATDAGPPWWAACCLLCLHVACGSTTICRWCVPLPPGVGHGRRVDERSGARLRNVAGRPAAKAMGMMQCAWSVGYAAAALVVAVVLPRFGWRAVFFVGIVPAFVALWMRRGIEESPEWLRSRSVHREWVTPVLAIFSPQYLRFTLLLTALSTTTIFAYWGLNLWVPAYLSLPQAQGGIGFTASVATLLVVLIQFGAFLGYVSFGWWRTRSGERRSFLVTS